MWSRAVLWLRRALTRGADSCVRGLTLSGMAGNGVLRWHSRVRLVTHAVVRRHVRVSHTRSFLATSLPLIHVLVRSLVLVVPRGQAVSVRLHSRLPIGLSSAGAASGWSTCRAAVPFTHRHASYTQSRAITSRRPLLLPPWVVRRIILLLPHLLVQVPILLEPISVHSVPFGLHCVDD